MTSGRWTRIASVLLAVSLTTGADFAFGTMTTNGQTVARVSDVQTFTASGTWTKPTGGLWTVVVCIGGGGGGASGAKSAATSGGGNAGMGGTLSRQGFPTSALGATETVTVGAGGTGGAAQASASTDGNDGTDGGDSSFGVLLVAQRGLKGLKGLALGTTNFSLEYTAGLLDGALFTLSGYGYDVCSDTSTGARSVGGYVGATNGQDGICNTSGQGLSLEWNSLGTFLHSPPFGGGGGGYTTNAVASPGGQIPVSNVGYTNTVVAAGAIPGGAGGAGVNVATNVARGGTGGGGGAGRASGGNGGAGGAGGLYGSGRGGGGGAINAQGNSGAGGAGAAGICQAVTWF